MTARVTTRWRRGLFQPEIAHLPDPDRCAFRTKHGRRQQGLCERYLRPDEPADPDTLRCPDCEQRDTEQQQPASIVPAPLDGPPEASA